MKLTDLRDLHTRMCLPALLAPVQARLAVSRGSSCRRGGCQQRGTGVLVFEGHCSGDGPFPQSTAKTANWVPVKRWAS